MSELDQFSLMIRHAALKLRLDKVDNKNWANSPGW